MCIYIYIINIHCTHICQQKLLFFMRLIPINNLTALIYIYIYIYIYMPLFVFIFSSILGFVLANPCHVAGIFCSLFNDMINWAFFTSCLLRGRRSWKVLYWRKRSKNCMRKKACYSRPLKIWSRFWSRLSPRRVPHSPLIFLHVTAALIFSHFCSLEPILTAAFLLALARWRILL